MALFDGAQGIVYEQHDQTGGLAEVARKRGADMTAKEAKAYLIQYRESLDRAEETAAHLAELKAEAVRLKDHKGQSIKLDAAVAKYIDACDDAGLYLKMLEDRRKEIKAVIDAVPNQKLQQLLREIYINGKKIVRIAADRDQTYEHICRLHGDALIAVCNVINKK